MFKASQVMNYNEFRVYMYIVTNRDGYDFNLSTKHISTETNTSKRNIQRAVNGLIEKGYIVQNENNTYSFLEDLDLHLENTNFQDEDTDSGSENTDLQNSDNIEQNNMETSQNETTGFAGETTETTDESDKNSPKVRQFNYPNNQYINKINTIAAALALLTQ